ncbi:hypothetical protein AY600_07265 [Phormidium willei BDU 130791]|nr:hypothetical protein AY600_07265 [Phormidium willei BDU 130791]
MLFLSESSSGHATVCLDLPEAPERFADRRQAAVYDFWRERRDGADVPPVAAIDPLALPRTALPFLGLLHREPESGRYFTRLVGTEVVEALGVDHTGRYVDEIAGMAAQLERFDRAVRRRQPYWATAPLSFAPHHYKHYSVLALPFARPGAEVSRLLFVFDFEVTPPAAPF